MDLQELADRAVALLTERDPLMIGISGAPGSGKTTLALALVALLSQRGYAVAHVPMDGFHLADAELERLGLRPEKGAAQTFDAAGYVALLNRIRQGSPFPIYAPSFDRTLEQPLAGAIPVPFGTQIVVTEGNYLLCPTAPWNEIPQILDQIWHCVIDDALRRQRLIARHTEFGKTPGAAAQWVNSVDEGNARTIEEWRHLADLVI